MDILGVIIIFAFLFVKAAAAARDNKRETPPDAPQAASPRAEEPDAAHAPANYTPAALRQAFAKAAGKESASARSEQERRHAAERRRSEREWAEARRHQADALRVHAVGVDSCEGRLESLRVLYDAGILDKDEYDQRVARVKARHAHQ